MSSAIIPSTMHHRFYKTSCAEQLTDCLKSPLVKALIISMVALTLFAYQLRHPRSSKKLLCVTIFALGTLGGILYYRKPLVFEALLIFNLVKNFFFGWEWWNKIDDNIYLGGIPLERFGHENLLKTNIGIKAVLSIVEDFEFEQTTVVGKAVLKRAWKTHLHLRCGDFHPPTNETLNKGAKWLKDQVEEGKKVYVHCKSGVGRSASIVVAYYMKYRGMTLDKARNKVALKRPYIFSSNSKNMRRMIEYRDSLQQV